MPVTLYDLLAAKLHDLYHPGNEPSLTYPRKRNRQAAARLAEVESWAGNPAAARAARDVAYETARAEFLRIKEVRQATVGRLTRYAQRAELVRLPRGVPNDVRDKLVEDMLALVKRNVQAEPQRFSPKQFVEHELQKAQKEAMAAERYLAAARTDHANWRRRVAKYNRLLARLASLKAEINRTRV